MLLLMLPMSWQLYYYDSHLVFPLQVYDKDCNCGSFQVAHTADQQLVLRRASQSRWVSVRETLTRPMQLSNCSIEFYLLVILSCL